MDAGSGGLFRRHNANCRSSYVRNGVNILDLW